MKIPALEIATALNSVLNGQDTIVDGVSIDSRSISSGQMFVAITADRDGHDFIDTAIANGCSAVLCDRPLTQDIPHIVVDDTSKALVQLAAHNRNQFAGKLVAITGSVGKTSTKDLATATCAAVSPTSSNIGSFNNEIGVPLTILNRPDDTEILITEMGARGIGHIKELCDYVKPSIGVVTRVAASHTELFGSIDGVQKGKQELAESVDETGTVVLNADDPRVLQMADATPARVITYGITQGDIRASNVVIKDNLSSEFDVEIFGTKYHAVLAAKGEHMVSNALAALAVAYSIDEAKIEQVIETLASASPSKWRMETSVNDNGTLIINDAYNANPTSTKAALDTVSKAPAENKVAFLGTMAELGPDEEQMHQEVAAYAKANGIEVYAVASPMYGEVTHLQSQNEAYEIASKYGDDHVVLVKGSRSTGLDVLADRLAGI